MLSDQIRGSPPVLSEAASGIFKVRFYKLYPGQVSVS